MIRIVAHEESDHMLIVLILDMKIKRECLDFEMLLWSKHPKQFLRSNHESSAQVLCFEHLIVHC